MRPSTPVSVLIAFVLAVPIATALSVQAGQDSLQQQAQDDYHAKCAACHGMKRTDKGTIAPGLRQVDFTAPQAIVNLTRESMIAGVSESHSAEARQRWGDLSQDRIAAIVDYIRNSVARADPLTVAGSGGRIYARSCSVCHGERGNAASWAKNSLYPPPRSFTSSRLDELGRQEMINAVTYGVGETAMVSFATQLDREEIAAVVDYIRAEFMPDRSDGPDPEAMQGGASQAHHQSLPQGHHEIASSGDHTGHEEHMHGMDFDRDAPFPNALVGDAAKGHRFYENNCAECHGLTGAGDVPRAYFMARKPRDFTSARARADLNRPHLFQSIAMGIRQTEMAAWSKVLSDQQIADVAEYVFRALLTRDASIMPADEESETGHSHSGHKHKKKTLTCEEPDDPLHQAGRQVYNANCYFCHGYSGDAQTVAAGLLDPPPRSFQNSDGLSRTAVLRALKEGRPGTAMRSFRRTLDSEEVAAVADFVLREFVLCRRNNTLYHTPANGWPDHERRYGAAYPFVLGTLEIDSQKPALDLRQRAGLALYREGCVICHDSFAITRDQAAGAA